VSNFQHLQQLQRELEAQEQLTRLDEQLRNHQLPVIERPKAVLELWDLWDKLRAVEKGEA
jgi:hypothetical protein